MNKISKVEQQISLRAELKGESAEQFLAIKKDLGLEQNSEVVRWIIGDLYKRLETKKEAVSP